jgi:streptogramin lyase
MMLTLAGACFAQPAAADPFAQITEFSTGLPAGSQPQGIAPGSDGNLWFTDQGSTPGIGRITPQGQITEFTSGLNSGSFPYRIAPGPDGNLWFTDRGPTAAIGRITPQGQITEFSNGLNAGADLLRVAPGSDGNMWFNDVGTHRAIGRITLQGQITMFSNGLNAGSRPDVVAPGSDGNIWFTDNGTTSAIGRITPQGQITEFSAGLNPGSSPSGLAPGPDGNLWFTDLGATKAIGRITPQAVITEFSSGLNAGGSLTSGIAAGPDGNTWFGDSNAAIGRVTPAGLITEYSSGLNSGSHPGRIVPGPDGNLWFTDTGSTPAVGRIGTGTPAASQGAPTITGSGRSGRPLTCQAAWSTWIGLDASASLYPFDGYQWSRDGVAIAGSTGRTFTPALGDAGHELTCSAIATYPLPLFVTAPTATSAVLIVQPAIPALTSLRVFQKVKHHHTTAVRVAYTLTAPGDATFTVERRGAGRVVGGRCVRATHANARRRRCRRVVIGSFQLLANAGRNQFTLPHRIGGQSLGPGSYWLVVTPSVNGLPGRSQTLAFKIR